MASIRRVYLPQPEVTDQQALRDQVRVLEKRVKSLKKDKLNLIERCESLSSECDNLVRREQDLQEDYDALEVKMEEAEGELGELNDVLKLAKQDAKKYKKLWTELSDTHREMEEQFNSQRKSWIRKLDEATKRLREYKYVLDAQECRIISRILIYVL